ncbi:MAG: NusA-like transcription termination signal-binding factor [Candidatus Nezhaarchaeales archaeon]
MPSIKFFEEELKYMQIFEALTSARTRDCVMDHDRGRILFLVEKGDMGLAIGKNGSNIKRINKLLGKNVEIVEAAEDPEGLIRNSLLPAQVQAVKLSKTVDGKIIAYVTVNPKDKGIAIGKNGNKIARARIFAKRHFNIDDVIIR